MSHESPINNELEGFKDGRQWTNSEILAFVGFLNDEKNDGALRNTTSKFMAPILKKASDFMTEKFPQRSWRSDTTLRSQFKRIREANAIANARLRDPESHYHMLALRDASKEEHGFSESLTTALLLWIQEDQRNARFWCAIKSLKAKLRCLQRKCKANI
ncbi:hypothetical protein E4U39_006057 [Claviceps sp. Clav50 group G5]|nr:hypothetical protein E4U39_006057 [Claviceps sp. Clav50 group G5]